MVASDLLLAWLGIGGVRIIAIPDFGEAVVVFVVRERVQPRIDEIRYRKGRIRRDVVGWELSTEASVENRMRNTARFVFGTFGCVFSAPFNVP